MVTVVDDHHDDVPLATEKDKIMAATNQGTGPGIHGSARRFAITRTFNAPRELVFKMWTDPEHFKHWWGPKGCTIGSCTIDLRPGGTARYSMRMPGGPETWGKFVYRQVLPPERLVFVSSFADPSGNIIRAPFSDAWPLEIENMLSLSEQFEHTNLTLLGTPVNATADEWSFFESRIESLHQGFSGTFDQLADYLAKL
jgi:uncharacterized protein YndB with AHSA1/START domain